MGVLSPVIDTLGRALAKSGSAYWAPWVGLASYAVGKLGAERSKAYNRAVYGRDEAALGWSILGTAGPIFGAAAYLGGTYGMFRILRGPVAKTAGKEAISKTTSAMTRPSRPAMASPHTFPRKISSRLVSGAGSIFGGTFGRVKAHPGWAVFGASLGASAFTYSNIPTGPNMVVPADSIQSARAKLRRSTNAVPFGMYYNRRRSIGGL